MFPFLKERVELGWFRIVDTEAGVQVSQDGIVTTLPADTVIIATGTVPSPSLYEGLVGSGVEIYVIGDATGARNTIQTASLQAYEIARAL